MDFKKAGGYALCSFLSAVLAVWLSEGRFWEQTNAHAAVMQPVLNPPMIRDAGNSMQDELTLEEQINVSVYENVNQSVVNITTKATRTEGFFLLDVPSEGSGSGSVIDNDGHILTNYHVIENAQQVNVTLYNGASYEAAFVGADPINDIAVIKIKATSEELHPVPMGDSSRLKVGMHIFALGNPFGFERTLTTGIISSLNRSLQVYGNRTIKSIIQIDAAVNPGNSGGPLLDTQSRLIGMNTAIATRSGQSAGVGFAIPVNLIKRVVPQLIEHGRVIRPEIGISAVFQTEKGLVIARLVPGGPAEKAGLRGPVVTRTRRGMFVIEKEDRTKADLILSVDGVAAKDADAFLTQIDEKNPGETVLLTISREGKTMNVPVILGTSEVIEGTPVR